MLKLTSVLKSQLQQKIKKEKGEHIMKDLLRTNEAKMIYEEMKDLEVYEKIGRLIVKIDTIIMERNAYEKLYSDLIDEKLSSRQKRLKGA